MDTHKRNIHGRRNTQAENTARKSSNEMFVKTLKLTLNTKISHRGARERKDIAEKTASSLQAKMQEGFQRKSKIILASLRKTDWGSTALSETQGLPGPGDSRAQTSRAWPLDAARPGSNVSSVPV